MPRILITGFQPDIKRISFVRLQTENLNIGLKSAKENLDIMLEGEELVFEIADQLIAEAFCVHARVLGVDCELLN